MTRVRTIAARQRAGRRSRGISYLEVIVASTVCVVCLSIMIQLWSFSMLFTMQTVDNANGCDLARMTIETLKETGFSQTPEYPVSAPQVHYYNINTQNVDSTPSAARYKVSTTVISDITVTRSGSVAAAGNALRTVTVTVSMSGSGTTLTTLTTYLAREGI